MSIKLNIRSKMLLSIMSTVIIISSISIGYISYEFRTKAFKDAKDYIDANAREHASRAMAEFNSDMDVIRTLTQAFANYKNLPAEKRADIHRDMYEYVFINNPQFYGIWDSWELSVLDPEWKLPTGRYVEEFWREGDSIHNNNTLKSLDGDNTDYGRLKREKLESIEEPYYYSYTGNKEDEILMTSFICPILVDSIFTGVVGTDITLDRFQEEINSIHPFENSIAFLISNQGILITHPDTAYINKPVTEILNDKRIISKIKAGKSFSFIYENKDKTKSYVSFAPIIVGNTPTPWSIGIAVPLDVILSEANSSISFTLIIGSIGLLLILILVWFIAYSITRPLQHVVKYAKSCSQGKLDAEIGIVREDEIGEMANALKVSTNYFREVIDLANQISKGNLSNEVIRSLDSKEGDLIHSLKVMVMQLKQITENIKSSTAGIMKVSENLIVNAEKINQGASQQEKFTDDLSQSMIKIEEISANATRNIIAGADHVNGTVDSMKDVVGKTKIIESIYSRTNFIAINAAVEAARAGEYGRGFAIVAKEIQSLAEQSKLAADDIDDISNQSIGKAQDSIRNLRRIIDDIQKTSDLIKTLTSPESDLKSQNGHSNISKLQEITSDNLMISNEISKNAQELARRTEVLNELLNFFQVD
ncbi:MAG: methyl-accepting chemotaxis protein [Bacteroidales bacterium]|nr:methyl-accepting chemotaxis protein [Bacteroidales bacterium]